MAFLVVQSYGRPGDYHAATVVFEAATVEECYAHIDATADRLARYNLTFEESKLDLTVVDEQRQPVPRPTRGVQ